LLIAEVGGTIRAAEPGHRADFEDLAETLLHKGPSIFEVS
jgi:hypothetical protein